MPRFHKQGLNSWKIQFVEISVHTRTHAVNSSSRFSTTLVLKELLSLNFSVMYINSILRFCFIGIMLSTVSTAVNANRCGNFLKTKAVTITRSYVLLSASLCKHLGTLDDVLGRSIDLHVRIRGDSTAIHSLLLRATIIERGKHLTSESPVINDHIWLCPLPFVCICRVRR